MFASTMRNFPDPASVFVRIAEQPAVRHCHEGDPALQSGRITLIVSSRAALGERHAGRRERIKAQRQYRRFAVKRGGARRAAYHWPNSIGHTPALNSMALA